MCFSKLYTDTQGGSDSFSLAKSPQEEGVNFMRPLTTNCKATAH